ncbi:MAG: hypothetical protein M3P50_11610, partial [Actinomycetota bacterium]|nr:hypothetical protein [Actinomycetota bacterium]
AAARGSSPTAGASTGVSAPSASTSASGSGASSSGDPFENLPYGDRPELQAGIAFAATFLIAKVLKIIAN